MYATDFEYDGQYLSDYGFIICDFNYSKGSVTVDTGSKLSFEKVNSEFSFLEIRQNKGIPFLKL